MPVDTQHCPLCGHPNQCAQAAAERSGHDCWCFSTPIAAQALARLSAEQIDKSCLCPQCAAGIEALDNRISPINT